MKKILIIGANGFTGRQIVNDLSACKQYKLTGCSLHPDILPNNAEDYRFIETDIRNEADVRHLFKEVQPDVVINCSALSVPDYCETHHEEAYLTNVTEVGQLADLCEEYKSRFIHLSTDFVFDGKINDFYTDNGITAASFCHPLFSFPFGISVVVDRGREVFFCIDKARTMLGYRPQKLKEILANWDKL